MSLRTGLVKAGRSRASPIGTPPGMRVLTLDNPEGWLSGEESIAMSRDRAMKISTVNRCVEVLSNSMAVLPIYIMDERTKERLTEHRLGSVLWGRANETMTSFDYQKLMMCNQLLQGNTYAWIFRDSASGVPRELIPLPPDYVTIRVDLDGRLWYFFSHPITGETTMLRPEDILHYKAYSEDGIEGISVLKRASMTLSTARAAQQYENATWMNGGQPCGMLTTETDLGDYEETGADRTVQRVNPKENIRKAWEAVHRGPGNAFRLAVLDLGLKYQPISMSNTDAQFVESSEIRAADICRFFSVPLHMVYTGKESYQSNEQNSLEFAWYTLMPYETQWSQEDGRKLLLPSEQDRGLRIKRELKVFLKGDSAAQAAFHRTMHELGAYSVNDILALEDRPAVPGGDARYASLNYVPLADWPELSRGRDSPKRFLFPALRLRNRTAMARR